MDVIRQTERLRDATARGAEIGAQSSAAHLFARAAASVAALIALFILSATAYAQSCSPAEPRIDSGAGFTPFGAREQLLARGGNRGRAWEWALGTDTRTRQKVQASLDWVSGRVYSWTLVNSGAGSEVLEIRDAGGLRLRLAYPSSMDAGNALELRVLTHPSVGAKTSIEASLTSLNGHSVSGSLSQPGTRTRSEQALYYYFPQMAQGFTAEGTVSLTYPKKPRSGSRVQFTVRAGTIPCSSAGNSPTVLITSPAAGGTFKAPASVTVTADAQDSDGTVAQVAFFANGTPIGTATSSPFTVQWANIPAGAYSLTAVATDNDGLQATSAAVPITVGAARALYFIHVDHLNTPRLVADGTQKTVWRWDQAEPFGNNPANEDSDGDAIAFSFPQRFPGQYYDAEIALHYNYFRDYDATIGRYIESDPIGLRGGLHTFAYALNRPTMGRDPHGLFYPKWHHLITLQAANDMELGAVQATELAGYAKAADWTPSYIESQSPSNSPWHCMRSKDLSMAAAQAAMDEFVANQISKCTLEALGRAIHAVQDCSARGHKNFQLWTGGIPSGRHREGDAAPSVAEIDEAYIATRMLITRFWATCLCVP